MRISDWSSDVCSSDLALSSLGLLGARIVFAHLAILAVALTFLRSRMHESPRWLEAQAAEANGEGKSARGRWRDLFTRQHMRSMAFLSGMYLFWNLWAGTNGFFFPYILRSEEHTSELQSLIRISYAVFCLKKK